MAAGVTLTGVPVVTINGVAVAVATLPAASDDISQRSQLAFTVQDAAGTLAIRQSQAVLVTDGAGNRVWAGWVMSATQQRIGATPPAYGWAVTATDNVYLLDKRTAASTYTNQTCGYIVRDLVTNVLAAEGVYYIKNLLSANQSSAETDLTGWAAAGAATLTRVTTQHWQGVAAVQVATDGTAGFQGAHTDIPMASLLPGGAYTYSVYAKVASGTASLDVRVKLSVSPFTSYGATNITLTTAWQRFSVSVTLPTPLPSGSCVFQLETRSTPAAVTWFMDGCQVEPTVAGASPMVWELGGTSSIQDGPTLTSYVIPYEQCDKHVDALATLASFYWNVDCFRRVWFLPYTALAAPFTFDGSQADDNDGTTRMAVQYTSPLYRNGQYLLGITEVTALQTETRKGDGTTTAFTWNYPLHSVPTITVDGVAKTVGIAGVDSGKDWYWNKGKQVVSQDTGGTKLTSANTLQCQYIGEYQTLVYAQDDGQVATQRTAEGGTTSGLVQQATTDTTLTTSAAGFQKASALLAKYATSGAILSFRTQTPGLAAGMLLTVNLPAAPWLISSTAFLIQSVQTWFDGFQWWYDVTALDGPVNDTWVQFWQRIAAQTGVIDTSSAGTSSTLTLLVSAAVGLTLTLSGTATPITYALPSASIYPAPTRYPGTVGTPVALTWNKTQAGLNALRDVLSGAGTSLQAAYLAWGTGTQGTPSTATTLASEQGRKQITSYANGGSVGEELITGVMGPQDGTGVVITEVGIFAGPAASGTANSGVLLFYGTYSHTHTNTESLNIVADLTFS